MVDENSPSLLKHHRRQVKEYRSYLKEKITSPYTVELIIKQIQSEIHDYYKELTNIRLLNSWSEEKIKDFKHYNFQPLEDEKKIYELHYTYLVGEPW